MLGLGVILNALGGDKESVKAFSNSTGKTITELSLVDNALRFMFHDGSRLRIRDAGQSCCENRYMSTDDDLAHYVGAVLVGGELRDAPSIPDKYGDHEVQFLVIKTDRGEFVVQTHNEHNGYYGGFWVVCYNN